MVTSKILALMDAYVLSAMRKLAFPLRFIRSPLQTSVAKYSVQRCDAIHEGCHLPCQGLCDGTAQIRAPNRYAKRFPRVQRDEKTMTSKILSIFSVSFLSTGLQGLPSHLLCIL